MKIEFPDIQIFWEKTYVYLLIYSVFALVVNASAFYFEQKSLGGTANFNDLMIYGGIIYLTSILVLL
jgi:hypothetical protein